MGDPVDVKALRARFHAQAERAISSGGAYSRPQRKENVPEMSDNGLLRSKLSPATSKPVLPLNPSTEPKRFNQSPQGVFPKPPPSHRVGSKEDLKLPVNDFESPSRVKLTGELLQNKMLQHLEKRPHAVPRSLLPSQKSLSEVTPLRKPLPNVGPRPAKPKRPPNVNLDRFHVKSTAFQPTVHLHMKSPEGPPRPPKTSLLNMKQPTEHSTKRNTEPEQDTYDDIDLPPPPPPPPKPSSSESWRSSFSSQPDEESDDDDDEIYEHIEDQEEFTQPVVLEKKKQKEHKRQQEVDKKEQKERLKKENECRKKFKLTGEVEVLHIARVREDWQGGKNDLRVRQGECVEIVRVKNNPGGKWLARNMSGEYGYISNTCVDVDYEEIKRKIKSEAVTYPLPVPEDDDVYDDVGSDPLNNSLKLSNEVYDDVDHVIPDDFPLPPPEIRQDPKKGKKAEKEEKEFRRKFKFEGPIQVLCSMMVDPNANIKKGGGKDLTVVKGEILEVIQQTNEKKVLCRNEQCKYGYVPRHYLLHEENEIYDDIDKITDIYDNDVH